MEKLNPEELELPHPQKARVGHPEEKAPRTMRQGLGLEVLEMGQAER